MSASEPPRDPATAPAPPTASAPLPAPSAGQFLDGAWHRLHPATPVLRGGIVLLAIAFFAGRSIWDGFIGRIAGEPDFGNDPIGGLQEEGLLGFAVLVVLGGVLLAVAWFTVSWLTSDFKIDHDAVTVRRGLLFRSVRTAKLDRIQGVTIRRPLLARLLGAARLELDVAGQNANVRLEYLGNLAAEGLRGDVLALASGGRRDERPAAPDSAEAPTPAPTAGIAEEGTPLLTIGPGRALASVLLSGSTVFLVLLFAVVFPVLNAVGAAFVGFASVLPATIGVLAVTVRRAARAWRYRVTASPDGVRIGSGVLATTNEAVPPGRIHAVRIEQPLLWRPVGWWRVTVNRAGGVAGGGSAEVDRSVAPVATIDEVQALLPFLTPSLAGEEQLVATGLLGIGDDGVFLTAPRRARWLRPLAWRREGFALTRGALLSRGGRWSRTLVLVPLARMQSVALLQGPADRLLRVAEIEPHVVSGPVRTRVSLIDEERAVRLLAELAEVGQRARSTDRAHRWAQHADLPAPVAAGAASASGSAPAPAGPGASGAAPTSGDGPA